MVMKKFLLLVVFFVFMFLTSGCITIYTDKCCQNKNLCQSTKKLVKADSGENFNPIRTADDWVKKNLW